MRMAESNSLQEKFRSDLIKHRDFMLPSMKNPDRFHYKGIPDFLLREGQFFEPRPLPAGIKYMEPKHCIKNTYWTALRERFVYVEGYAMLDCSDTPIFHAWNVDRDGFVVDTTWNPHGRVYFGVIFPLAMIRRKRRTQYSVIDDWEHGYPILCKPWDRETSTRQADEELKF